MSYLKYVYTRYSNDVAVIKVSGGTTYLAYRVHDKYDLSYWSKLLSHLKSSSEPQFGIVETIVDEEWYVAQSISYSTYSTSTHRLYGMGLMITRLGINVWGYSSAMKYIYKHEVVEEWK